jgi:hypothetical protein
MGPKGGFVKERHDKAMSHLSPEHRRAAIERLVTRRPATDYPAAASAE